MEASCDYLSPNVCNRPSFRVETGAKTWLMSDQKQTLRPAIAMSALPPKAEIATIN
jgi:hypothetical protein